MAITFTGLTSGNNGGTDSSTAVTASVTLTAGRLYLLAVENSHSSTPPAPTASSTGATWVQVDTVTFDSISSPGDRLTVLRTMVSSNQTGAITLTGTGSLGWGWSLTEVDGVDTSGTDGSGAIQQSVTNRTDSGTSLSITLAALQSGSATYGAFANGNNSATTPGSGYTEIHDTVWSGPDSGLETEYKVAGSTTVNCSGVASGSQIAGIGIEIKTAAAGGATTRGTAFGHRGTAFNGGRTFHGILQ